jgi:hypothetical protein
MADLVDGRYPETNALWSILGQTANVAQSDIPVRSNLEYLNAGSLTDSTAGIATGVMKAVPVAVDQGQVVSAITVLVGATAGATMTHQWAALYQGTGAAPALIGQSTDATSGAIAASAAFKFTLATPQLITSTNAPYGFIYAAVMVAATTVPSLATAATPTAVTYAWTTNGPLGLSLTSGSSLTTTATATLASPTAAATAPIVLLS